MGLMDEMLMPCEERVLTSVGNDRLKIGILREDPLEETRLALTPQGVEVLVSQGHEVVIESSAGQEARFSDKQYVDAGAKIVESRKEAYDVDVVVRITLPKEEDLQYIKPGQTIVAFVMLHCRGANVYKALADKKCNILALDFISDGGSEPVVSRCLGELEGMMSVTTAAYLLEKSANGKGIIIGGVTGVPPTEIVILGSGMAAINAARIASSLGATVKVFDSNHAHLQALSLQVSHNVFTSILHPQALAKAMTTADVVIGMRVTAGGNGFFATEENVGLLKKGAVVVDLNTTFGGRFETSKATTIAEPTYVVKNVIHHCLPDITVLAPHTATIVLSDIITPFMTEMGLNGNYEDTVRADEQIKHGTVMLNGVTTNECVAKRFATDYYDIKLMLL